QAPNSPQQGTPKRDAVVDAQTTQNVPVTRPEQQKTEHDRSDIFKDTNAESSSPVLNNQPDQGKMPGFDFSRDPLGSKRPMMTFEEIMAEDVALKPGVMAAQRQLLESRYILQPKLDPEVKMSRGKPLAVGPTLRLANGVSWESLAAMSPEEMRRLNAFPYPSLPHPKHTPGGQVFPKMQIDMFPRLERFDVDFDIPDCFLPEFPPAMFLTSRPELGD